MQCDHDKHRGGQNKIGVSDPGLQDGPGNPMGSFLCWASSLFSWLETMVNWNCRPDVKFYLLLIAVRSSPGSRVITISCPLATSVDETYSAVDWCKPCSAPALKQLQLRLDASRMRWSILKSIIRDSRSRLRESRSCSSPSRAYHGQCAITLSLGDHNVSERNCFLRSWIEVRNSGAQWKSSECSWAPQH